MDAAQHIAARLETLTNTEKAEVVKLLVDRVAVDGKEIQIRMVLDTTGYATSGPPDQPA